MAVKRTGCSQAAICVIEFHWTYRFGPRGDRAPPTAIRLIEHTTVLPTSRHDRVRCRAIDALRSVGLEDSHRYRPAVGALDPKIAIETPRPLMPLIQSRRWSAIATAADMADESLRASMIAVPRLLTFVDRGNELALEPCGL